MSQLRDMGQWLGFVSGDEAQSAREVEAVAVGEAGPIFVAEAGDREGIAGDHFER